MSGITDRFLAQVAEIAEVAEPRAQTHETPRTPKSQDILSVEPLSTQERKEKEVQIVREGAGATSAISATSPALNDVLAYFNNASRGPCIRCGGPVTRLGDTHGFRNGFGELVHLTSPARSVAVACAHCNRSVTEREAVDIGHGVMLHKACGSWVRRLDGQ